MKLIETVWNKLSDKSLRLQDRLFYVFCLAGILCSLIAFLAAALSGLPLISVWGSFACFCVMTILGVYSFFTKELAYGRIVICLGLNLFLFPVLFCLTGGLESGMILYFLLGICLGAVILEGKSRIVLITVFIIEYSLIIFLTAKHPALLVHISVDAGLSDVICSFIIVAVFVGSIISILTWEYSREYEKVLVLNRELVQQSVLDDLTRLYNRRYLMQFLSDFVQSGGQESVLSLVMFDLDGFKGINDRYGHLCGNEVLVRVAQIMHEEITAPCFAVRYGGEEFVCVFPGKDKEGAFFYAEKIRVRMKEDERLRRLAGMVTVSGGVAQYLKGMGIDGILKNADTMLYQAKSEGKDRIKIL